MKLLPFQKRFYEAACRSPVTCFSAPRGNGKTTLAGLVAAMSMRSLPKGFEVAIVAGTVNQARAAFRFTRLFLGETGFTYQDSAQRCTITRSDGARLSVMAASGRAAMGLVRVPLVIADEPAAWRQNDGELLSDALITAMGKPNSKLRVVFTGTLAPLGVEGHWWHSMVMQGSRPGYHVMLYQGDARRWRDLRHVYAVNPLSRVDPEFRATLRRERDEAVHDTRLLARFMSYRLNIPSRDEADVLLSVADWQRVTNRPEALPAGKPVVGVDLGGGRAWSAAVAVWRSGRVEAVAVAPGLPSIAEQEKRDVVPGGAYRRLVEAGVLIPAEGLRVPPAWMLLDAVRERWGEPEAIICDRFRLDDLRDAKPGCRVVVRETRWSEASADVRALRKMAKDGPLSCRGASRSLLTASLAAAMVKHDDAGNTRMVKKDPTHNTGRDDVAAALVLAAGAVSRLPTSNGGPRLTVIR